MARRYWLLKTEPGVFSFADLQRAGSTGWGGVRNYQARNLLRDELKPGDRVLIYHSNAEPSAVAGLAEVVRGGHPDPTQFDQGDADHHDAKSSPDAPRWFQVEVRALAALKHPVSLERIKRTPALAAMLLVRRGMRLSVQPVAKAEYDAVVKLGKTPG